MPRTRAKRRKTQALLIEQVFSKPAAHILRRLLSFGDPRSLGNVEATGRLLGGRGQVEGEARSLVELAVRDRLAALGRLDLARMEAPRLAAGEAWSELLLFAMRLPSAPHRRIDGSHDYSFAIKEGAVFSWGAGVDGCLLYSTDSSETFDFDTDDARCPVCCAPADGASCLS